MHKIIKSLFRSRRLTQNTPPAAEMKLRFRNPGQLQTPPAGQGQGPARPLSHLCPQLLPPCTLADCKCWLLCRGLCFWVSRALFLGLKGFVWVLVTHRRATGDLELAPTWLQGLVKHQELGNPRNWAQVQEPPCLFSPRKGHVSLSPGARGDQQ